MLSIVKREGLSGIIMAAVSKRTREWLDMSGKCTINHKNNMFVCVMFYLGFYRLNLFLDPRGYCSKNRPKNCQCCTLKYHIIKLHLFEERENIFYHSKYNNSHICMHENI